MDNKNFMAAFEQYNKSHEQKKRVSGEDILKKYFQPVEGTQRIRLMPPLQGEDYFEEAWFHMVRETAYNKNSDKTYIAWKKHYCGSSNDPKVQKVDANGNAVLDKDGKPYMVRPYCPLCAKKDEILATQDQSVVRKKESELTTQAQKEAYAKNKEIFKEAMQYAPKRYFLVRILDLDRISDGVKIWQFPYRKDKKGMHDLFMSAIERFNKMYPNNDWTDLEQGCTFELLNVEVPTKNGGMKIDVQQIRESRDLTPATEDSILMKKIAEDKTKWTDLHKKKERAKITHEQYLERVIKRTNPYYDNNQKKWIFPDPADAELQSLANNRSDDDLTASSSNESQQSQMAQAAVQNEVEQQNTQPDMDSLTPEQVDSMPTIDTNTQSSGINMDDDIDDLPF